MAKIREMLITPKVKLAIRGLVPQYSFSRRSFSQEAEDLILMRMFENINEGFYIDIGAHHPFRFSNTYAFYKRGWRGIVVDPLPGLAGTFAQHRPGDIVINMGVSDKQGDLTYHMFNESALNTFDATLAAERKKDPRWKILSTLEIECTPLHHILERNMPDSVSEINFLSVDTEGLDLLVLQSNDWDKYRPTAVVAECLNRNLDDLQSDELVQFMRSVGYVPFAKAFHSVIFKLLP